MRFVRYLASLFVLQIFFVFIQCQQYEPLALRIGADNTFQITPKKYYKKAKKETKIIYDNPSPETNPILRFCPQQSSSESNTADYQKKNTNSLYYIDSIKKLDIQNICDKPPKPVLARVTNPQEFLNIENPDYITWYASGFKIYARTEKKKKKNSSSNSSIQLIPKSAVAYEALDEGFDIILGLIIFFDENLHRTRAVKYDLMHAEVFEIKDDSLSSYTQTEGLDLSEFRQLFETSSEIVRFPLAPPKHFMYDLWASVARIDANLAPINRKIINRLTYIDNQLIEVAKVMGKLDIISGTSILKDTTTDENSSNSIQIPEIAWKIVKRRSPTNTLGIILVVNNLLTENKGKLCGQKEDVCQKNKWTVRELGVSENEVYCCNLDETALINLKADFFGLKQEKPFVLERNK